MASTDVIKTGAVYRVLAAISPVTWNKLSFWTKASDVNFNDSKTAEQKVGAIDGISSDENSNSSSYAASTELVQGLTGENTIITISTSDWSSGTTTINGNTYHTYIKNITKDYLPNPIMYLLPNNSSSYLPTDDEKDAFSQIEMEYTTRGSGIPRLMFYSPDIPSVTLKIGVIGVKE